MPRSGFDALQIEAINSPSDKDVLEYQADGTLKWASQPERASGFSAISMAFSDSAKDYREYTGTSWEVLGTMIFPGTQFFTPSKVRFCVSRNGTNGLAELRVYDFTNSLQVDIVSFSATDKQIVQDTGLMNLSTGMSVWEIQGRVDSPSASKGRIHFVHVL